LEIIGFFVLSPFPAVRRLMGVVVVATILIGRLASRTCQTHSQRTLVRGLVIGSVVLGLCYYGVDLREAYAARSAAVAAARIVRERDPNATVWCCGAWGFQFYGEQAGMKLAESQLRAGDWLVVGDARFAPWTGTSHPLETMAQVQLADPIPLRTVVCYYGGRTSLEHHEGLRYSTTIYRCPVPAALRSREAGPRLFFHEFCPVRAKTVITLVKSG
jgi:hypothetical protein